MRQKIKRQAKILAAVNLAAGAGEIAGLWILHYLLKGNKTEVVILCVYLLSLWWIWRRCVRLFEKPFDSLLDEADEAFQNKYKAENMRTKAEMHALQSQINPHFLYNTLDTLRWIALKNKDKEVADEIYHLSNLYRYYLNHEDVFVPVQEEVKLIETYMSIQHLRFHDKFDFRVNLETDAEGFMIPKLLLQPLIENSIQHGFPDKEESCMIILSVKKAPRSSYDPFARQRQRYGQGNSRKNKHSRVHAGRLLRYCQHQKKAGALLRFSGWYSIQEPFRKGYLCKN